MTDDARYEVANLEEDANVARAEALLAGENATVAGMDALGRAFAAHCSPLAAYLAGDAAGAAAQGKTAPEWVAERLMLHEDEPTWALRLAVVEDELRSKRLWPWP